MPFNMCFHVSQSFIDHSKWMDTLIAIVLNTGDIFVIVLRLPVYISSLCLCPCLGPDISSWDRGMILNEIQNTIEWLVTNITTARYNYDNTHTHNILRGIHMATFPLLAKVQVGSCAIKHLHIITPNQSQMNTECFTEGSASRNINIYCRTCARKCVCWCPCVLHPCNRSSQN